MIGGFLRARKAILSHSHFLIDPSKCGHRQPTSLSRRRELEPSSSSLAMTNKQNCQIEYGTTRQELCPDTGRLYKQMSFAIFRSAWRKHSRSLLRFRWVKKTRYIACNRVYLADKDTQGLLILTLAESHQISNDTSSDSNARVRKYSLSC
jgi:hypothetical protein